MLEIQTKLRKNPCKFAQIRVIRVPIVSAFSKAEIAGIRTSVRIYGIETSAPIHVIRILICTIPQDALNLLQN
jgi:hypothetical protein